VVPTVLDLAGVKKPQEIMGAAVPESPGVSLKPALMGNQSVSRDSIWWLHEGNRALRVGDWKIVMAKDETWQLYDLSKDRGEINDLSGKMPEKVRQMQTQWERQFEEISSLAKRDLKPEDLRKAADAVKKKAARKKN
jgi:arylsulfatase